jgi:hypothetical protein
LAWRGNGDLEDVRSVAAAVAAGAANEDVAEELHFDLLEAGATAALALALGRVETEGAGVQAALPGWVRFSEERADVVKRADIDGGVGARGLAQGRLVHVDNAAQRFPTLEKCGVRSAECGVGSAE